jgi:hypothetical protein
MCKSAIPSMGATYEINIVSTPKKNSHATKLPSSNINPYFAKINQNKKSTSATMLFLEP